MCRQEWRFVKDIYVKNELHCRKKYVKICYGVIVLQGGQPPGFPKAAAAAVPFGIIPLWEIWKREVMNMSTYEVLSLLFLGGSFLMSLLAYLDNRNKRK